MKLVLILVENTEQVTDIDKVLREAENEGEIDFAFGFTSRKVDDDFMLSRCEVS